MERLSLPPQFLRTTSSPVNIGLLAGAANDHYVKALVDGVLEVTQKANARLVCFTCGNMPSNILLPSFQNEIFQLIDLNSIDALILSGTLSHNVPEEVFREFCRQFSSVPVVTMSVKVPEFPGIVTEQGDGMRDLMTHLLDDHGYQRVAFIGGPEGQQEAELRKSIFLQEMEKRNLEARPEWMQNGDFSHASGMAAMARLLEGGNPLFQGVVAANDMMALGALNHLESNGYRVPRNLFVTGYDDFPTRSLTTVHQPTFQQAREAAQQVFQLLWGESVPAVTHVPSSLIVRSSCGCTPGDRHIALAKYGFEGNRLSFWPRVEGAYRRSLQQPESGDFLNEIQRLLEEGEGPALGTLWHEILARLREDVPHGDEALLGQGSLLIAEHAMSRESKISFNAEMRALRLKDTSEALMNSLSMAEVSEVLVRDLPAMGLRGCWLSLFDDPHRAGGLARLELAFDESGRLPISPGGQHFPAAQLKPGGIRNSRPDDLLVIVGVLYTRHDLLGFVVFSSDREGSQVCDALRSQISGAIRGAQLWEERLRTEKQMVQSEKMAALGSLVAGVAHEINTPVGIGVTAASDLRSRGRDIIERYRKNDLSRSQFDVFIEFLEEGSRLIEVNLLKAGDLIRSFKQIAVDQSHEEIRSFQLGDYLRDIVLSLHPQFKAGGHTCVVQCPGDLVLSGPPGSLAQIFSNLISNAVFHGFEDKKNGKMLIDCRAQYGKVHIEFSDDGRGIGDEIVGRIFEPFFTTKLGHGGSGLGLHIVYNQVVQIWNGTIECVSEPGRGTTFVIDFPLR